MDVDAFTHVMAALGVLARGADVISTRLVTPKLVLEANPLMRRFGWPAAWATLLFGLIAYYSIPFVVILIVMSLLVAGSNLMRGWFARFLGEKEVERIMIDAVRRGRLSVGLGFVLGSGACIAATGALLAWLSGPSEWGFYAGFGVIGYGLAVAVHGSSNLARLFRKAREPAV